MALIKLTAIVDNISGKLNGTVFAKNKGGNYMRSKSKPSNPKTAAQMAVRAQFGAISSAWKALTESARSAWRESASNFPYINRLGDSKILSGFALHQKLNTNLDLIGESMLTFPPEPISPVNFSSIKVDAIKPAEGPDQMNILAPLVTSDPNVKTLIFATPPLSHGVENFENKLRLIGVKLASSFASENNVNDLYEEVFGELPVGAKVGVRVQNVSTVSGMASSPFYATSIKEEKS